MGRRLEEAEAEAERAVGVSRRREEEIERLQRELNEIQRQQPRNADYRGRGGERERGDRGQQLQEQQQRFSGGFRNNDSRDNKTRDGWQQGQQQGHRQAQSGDGGGAMNSRGNSTGNRGDRSRSPEEWRSPGGGRGGDDFGRQSGVPWGEQSYSSNGNHNGRQQQQRGHSSPPPGGGDRVSSGAAVDLSGGTFLHFCAVQTKFQLIHAHQIALYST